MRLPGGLARRHDARLRPLAGHAQLLGVGVEVGHVEVHELLGAQPAAVGELEHRAVAQRRAAAEPGSRRARPPPRRASARAAGTGRASGVATRSAGLASSSAALHEVAVEGADRGDLARHRGLRQAALRRARRRSAAASAGVSSNGARPCAAAHSASCCDVGAVGRARLLGHAAGLQRRVERARSAPHVA